MYDYSKEEEGGTEGMYVMKLKWAPNHIFSFIAKMGNLQDYINQRQLTKLKHQFRHL